MIGHRRDESEARVQECTVFTNRRVIVAARSSLASTRISYVTLRREHEHAYLVRPH